MISPLLLSSVDDDDQVTVLDGARENRVQCSLDG